MRHVLHIITKKNDALARIVVEEQQGSSKHRVETIELTQPKPNYDELVRKIFEADSIEVW